MFNRKSVFVALTVVMMLAMLVPVSFAAPEWTHGISIVKPSGADPVWVKYETGSTFDVDYMIASTGASVAQVKVTFKLSDQNGVKKQELSETLNPPVDADQTFSFGLNTGLADGYYNLQVCAIDLQAGQGDPAPEEFCSAVEVGAVILDSQKPYDVMILKPVSDEKITGQYEIIATAKDKWPGHVESMLVSYKLDGSVWVELGEAAPNGVLDTWSIPFDSTQVPDGKYCFHVTATDEVDWATTSKDVCAVVDNGYTINLKPGWNLISTPIMLYDASLASALSHLHDAAGNPTWKAIYTMANEGGDYVWSGADSAGALGDLDKMVDGQGYWIYMKAKDDLWLRGTWAQVGPVAPPQYAVSKGWNLIGFTNWGKPPAFSKTRHQYLGNAVNDLVQVMYEYKADGTFGSVKAADNLNAGQGYWLALLDGGTIYP